MTQPNTSDVEGLIQRIEPFALHAADRYADHGSLIFCSGKTLRPNDLVELIHAYQASERARLKAEGERDELDRAWFEDRGKWARSWSALEARADRLEKALRPFADHAAFYDNIVGGYPDENVPCCRTDGARGTHIVTIGDFRKARAALSADGEGGK